MQTFNSRETVKARKVTDKDGETVITARGPEHAEKGSYVVYQDTTSVDPFSGEDVTVTAVRIQDAESFGKQYKTRSTRKTAQKRATAPSKPQTGKSAAARVRGSQK